MDKSIRIHALEGAMVSTKNGIERLYSIIGAGKEKSQVFVVPPTLDPELSFYNLIDASRRHGGDLATLLENKKRAWHETLRSVLPSESCVSSFLEDSFSSVGDLLKAISILSSPVEEAVDYLENLSSRMLVEILAAFLSGKGTVVRKTDFHSLMEDSNPLLAQGVTLVSAPLEYCQSDRDAAGRVREDGWGEYSASLLAAHLGAPLTFWNQKSLLYSASKKDVPSAHIIRNLTYAEATELSFFGAPIVHPHSFIPAEDASLPLSLRYWGEPEEEGTLVTSGRMGGRGERVKAFSVVKNISLINVEGSGMSGVPGVSSRLFTALRNENISVIFISQASSEYSICFAVPEREEIRARETLLKEFGKEREEHRISSIAGENGLSIIAVVGEDMPGRIGVAGSFFSALARAGVNVRAIAQGSSERNISAVIRSKDAVKAERALHSVFFMSQQTLSLGLFGPGNIGGTLLDQIGREKERLKREFDLDIRVRGIATSRLMVLSQEGIDLSAWREELEKHGMPYDEEIFLSHIAASYYPHAVLVDATASFDRAMQYKDWIEQGFHVITPNKKASSGPYPYYLSLFETSLRTGRKFLYETTVGAGLPIITTLKDLRETGDIIEKVEGMVSGTLSWLFSSYDGSVPFSEMVLKAKAMGFTEPDPRDDLSGMDVARKTVILARELGYEVEVSDLEIRNLVPPELRNVSREEFLERISEMDSEMLDLYRDAAGKGMKLRYVGTVENGKCSVSLSVFPSDHPFSQAKGTDNVIEFTTQRYHNQPLVVQGPGAGPDVTAAGIFADILRLSAYLGSRI